MRSTLAYSATLNSPIGMLGVVTQDESLFALDFLPNNHKSISPQNKTAEGIITQLTRYFEDGTFSFNLPIQTNITDFQKKVYQALTDIKPGTTQTYGELAKKLNTSARAIGNACRTNPTPIIIPCHRIVSQQGIGGYSGETQGNKIHIKTWLLTHEQ